MPDPIEFDPVDLISIGALGQPGQRRFMIQATKEGARLCVMLEKQQVALLASEAEEFLDRVTAEDNEPEPMLDPASDALCGQVVDAEPLFRVRLIGIGYDRDRHLVLLELREQADEDDEGHPLERDEIEGHIARVYADARPGPRHDPVCQHERGVGTAHVPAVRAADGSRRALLPPVELTLLAAQAGIELPAAVDDTTAAALLEHGEIDIVGRMPWSSNATFLVRVEDDDGHAMLAIYKPQAGERPLWDFPDGTLAAREVAAHVVSELLGWSLVPRTVLRDGPVGVGALSQFHDHDPEQHYFEIVNGREDTFRRFAAFDAVINNTDRKGGHVLLDTSGHVWGIDHGTSFHVHPKLRTVIWDFAGERIAAELLADLECLHDRLTRGAAPQLQSLLGRAEIEAVLARTHTLLTRMRFPVPSGDYHDYPWPTI